MAINVGTANASDRQRDVLYVKRWLQDTCVDAFTGQHAIFAKLRAKKKVFQGGFGDQLVVPIEHPAAGGPQASGVVDPTTHQTPKVMTGISRAKFDIAEVMINMAIPRRELRAGRAPAKMVDYQNTVWDLARKRFYDKLTEWLWTSEGNAASAGSESQIMSILTMLNKGGSSSTGPWRPMAKAAQYCANNDSIGWSNGTHGPAAGSSPVTTIGGINRNAAGNVYHCVPVLNPSSAATFGRSPINQTLTLSRRGTDYADLGILDANHYDQLQDILQAQYLLKPSKLQEYGYTSLVWGDGCDIVWDDECPVGTGAGVTGQFLALNTDRIGFYADGQFAPDVIEGGAVVEAPYIGYMMLGYYSLVPKILGRGLGARHANLA